MEVYLLSWASVITAFMLSSDALVSWVVLLSRIGWTSIIRAFQIELMCIFSVRKLFFMCGASDDGSYVCFGETKDRYFNR